jgi:protoheme IX farnesyltransferase
MSHLPTDRPSLLVVLLDLTKVRITVAVTLTTAMGYILFSRYLEIAMAGVVAGMFLLACGSAALNQWQDAAIDARMERTRRRPIPAGFIDPTTALFLSILLMLIGLYILTVTGRQPQTLLALSGLAVTWYNGVYTYLKRWSAFAAVPGALIGAIPPVVGYVAAGGSPTDDRIILPALLLFIWQVPHFWLLLLLIGGQYAGAGQPTLTQLFSPRQLRRVTFMWVLAAAGAGAVFPAMFPTAAGLPWSLGMLLASAWLAVKSITLLYPGQDERVAFRKVFLCINVFALAMVVCLIGGAFLTSTLGHPIR